MTWQPIETAPKDGQKVLLVNGDGAIDIGCYVEDWLETSKFVRHAKDGDVFRTVREDFGYWDTKIYCPTHWMPLPKGPE